MPIDAVIIKPIIAGAALSIIAGYLGCIVVWKKYSFFSDTLSHSLIPGLAIGFMLNISIFWAAFFTAIFLALSISWVRTKMRVPIDTVMVICSQVMFSVGVIMMHKSDEDGHHLMHMLMGDIESISYRDISYIVVMSIIILPLIIINWKKIVLMCVNEEIAAGEGVKVNFLNCVIIVLIAIFTAFALKTVGIILASSLLLIPVATAATSAKNPYTMPIHSTIIGCSGIIAGIITAYYLHIPVSPAIVIALATILLLKSLIKV